MKKFAVYTNCMFALSFGAKRRAIVHESRNFGVRTGLSYCHLSTISTFRFVDPCMHTGVGLAFDTLQHFIKSTAPYIPSSKYCSCRDFLVVPHQLSYHRNLGNKARYGLHVVEKRMGKKPDCRRRQ